jgi:SAM-dependent methyltransferase
MRPYVIRGGEEGKARLAVLARILWPTTHRLLDDAGLAEGMRCLDVGCGGGDVTLELARLVGPGGRVVGLDGDGVILSLARQDAARAGLCNVEYRQADAAHVQDRPAFDLAYARFLLTHVTDPEGVLANMRHATRGGGAVVVEDIDFSGHFCHPPCRAFARYVELYQEVVRRRGGDPDIGPKLPGLFLAAGVAAVQVRVVQPAALHGEVKSLASITLEKVADAVIAERLASPAEITNLVGELTEFAESPRTLMSLPRVFQVWGRSPARPE